MYVRVHAIADAKKERVVVEKENELTIHVREPAVRNLANTRIRELVSQHYQTPLSTVTIVSGHRSPTKMINVEQ